MQHSGAASTTGRRIPAPARPAARGAAATCSCESQWLCELHGARELSAGNDNCKRGCAVVYSASRHKGKPVERRGRKASGPTARGRRIAGLPAERSSRSSVRHPSSFFPRYFVRAGRLVATACATRLRARHAQAEERGAPGIESGKPVARRGRKASGLRELFPRQRGCHMSHVAVRDAVTCADRRVVRRHAYACAFSAGGSLPGEPRVVAPNHSRQPLPASGRLRGHAQRKGRP
jgi:hypothetical protein